MPGVKTYGKRTRAVYDARLAFSPSSSPDRPTTKPPPPPPPQLKVGRVKSVVLKKCSSAQDDEEVVEMRQSPRRALGERHVNTVILPEEAVNAMREDKTSQPRGARPKVAEDGKTAMKQNIDMEGKVASHGRHTFFRDEEEVGVKRKDEAAQPEHERAQVLPQLRRSPRKTKQAPKLVPMIPRHDAALDHVRHDANVEMGGSEQPLAKQADQPAVNCPYRDHCAEFLDLSTHPLTDFAMWSQEISEHFQVTKIAEASFGEVYRLSLLEDISDFCSTDESVFKVIPLTPAPAALPVDKRKRAAAWKKAEGMTSPHDVATEVKLLQRMSSIPGFTNFRDIRILQGRPPAAFIEAFQAWNTAQKSRKKDPSHFPDPAKKSSYNADQLWAVIEMQDAGSDLERLVESGACTAIFPVWDIFWHTALSIAKGEEGAEFEHRDLHLGNICVRSPPTSTSPFPFPQKQMHSRKQKLNFTPLEITIIDYTLSRCCLMPSAEPASADDESSAIAYTDLSTPSQAPLFEGDSTEEYQYDIYRYMRGALYMDRPFAPIHELSPQDLLDTGRTWEQFHPQTNLVWLHLVLYKLLEQMEWPSGTKAPAKRKKPEEFAVWKRANDLEFVLLQVQDLLDPESICENGIRSATDLVAFAVGEGWLDVEDVMGEVDESALVSQLEGLEIQ